jgi:hypothetical protein
MRTSGRRMATPIRWTAGLTAKLPWREARIDFNEPDASSIGKAPPRMASVSFSRLDRRMKFTPPRHHWAPTRHMTFSTSSKRSRSVTGGRILLSTIPSVGTACCAAPSYTRHPSYTISLLPATNCWRRKINRFHTNRHTSHPIPVHIVTLMERARTQGHGEEYLSPGAPALTPVPSNDTAV